MYDIDILEAQWKKYNKKKRRPYYIVSFFFILISALGSFIFMNKELVLTKVEAFQSKKVSIKKDNVYKDLPITTLALKKKKIGSDINLNTVKPISPLVIDTNPMEPEDVLIEVRDAPKHIAPVSDRAVPKRKRPKMHLEIVEMSGERAYVDVKNRFSIAPDPDDSLFLARNYYRDKKYSKAAYWALQTNKLNGDIEESWLIFARAKAKTGQKNEAIRVLSEYAKRSNSDDAYKLLKELKK